MIARLVAAAVCLAAAAHAQVAPLSVTLQAEAPCPAPAQRSPLLALPTGCPAPWAGVLYTDGEHDRMRQEFATLEAVAKARREQMAQRSQQLLACRRQRDEQGAACVKAAVHMQAALEAWQAPAVPDARRAWPWAVVSGGLTAIAAGAPAALGRPAGEVFLWSVAGVAAGGAVALVVDLVER